MNELNISKPHRWHVGNKQEALITALKFSMNYGTSDIKLSYERAACAA